MNKCRLVHFFLNQLQYLIMGAYYFPDLHQKYRLATLLWINCFGSPPGTSVIYCGSYAQPQAWRTRRYFCAILVCILDGNMWDAFQRWKILSNFTQQWSTVHTMQVFLMLNVRCFDRNIYVFLGYVDIWLNKPTRFSPTHVDVSKRRHCFLTMTSV
jgi:hypothetical protein